MSFLLWFCLYAAQAQENWKALFDDIENNNLELQSLRQQLQAQDLLLQQENKLKNLQLDGFYLQPHQQMSTQADYIEFQVTQGLDFPLLYAERAKKRNLWQNQLEQTYQLKRQDILWEVEQHLFTLVYLDKKIELEKERNQRAKKNVSHYKDLWDAGQIDKITLNKAKLVWLQEQFLLQQLAVEREHLVILLQELQGGKELQFLPTRYVSDVELPSLEEIWSVKKESDVHLKILDQKVAIARQDIQIASYQRYPDIRIGYNIQGNEGALFSGLYVGLEVPLWGNRNEVMISKLNLKKEELRQQERLLHEELFLDVHYGDHQILVEKYKEYLRILDELGGEDLLEEGLLQGEFSFVAYQQELSFYRDAVDQILEMEWQLQKSKSHLLKYKL